MRRGRRLWKGGRRDSRLLLNTSVVMERDRITGRPPAAPSPNSELYWCFGKSAPNQGVTFIHSCGRTSVPLDCSEAVGCRLPRAEPHQVWLSLRLCPPSPRRSARSPAGHFCFSRRCKCPDPWRLQERAGGGGRQPAGVWADGLWALAGWFTHCVGCVSAASQSPSSKPPGSPP